MVILVIQKKFGYSDRELAEQITENPYLQYFIGLPGYQDRPPFDASTLVLFRKRLDIDVIMESNAYMFDRDEDHTQPPSAPSSGGTAHPGMKTPDPGITKGRLLSMRPAHRLISGIPRTYRCSMKQTRKAIRKQLSYVRRDLAYLDSFMSEGYAPAKKEIPLLLTVMELYKQQQYMYENKTHSVKNRIVSISQPWIRPIVLGKVKAPTEFGAKFDLGIDERGYARIEHNTMRALTCKMRSAGIVNGPAIIRNAFWWIRSIGPVGTGLFVRIMG